MKSQRKEQCRFIELFELFNNMKNEMVSETKIIIYKKNVSIEVVYEYIKHNPRKIQYVHD